MFNSTSGNNKKRVPDWLNSSLWSSSPPPPPASPSPKSSPNDVVADRGVKSTPATSAKSSVQKAEASKYEPPAPAPPKVAVTAPPAVVVRAEAPKVEAQDLLGSQGRYYSSEDDEEDGARSNVDAVADTASEASAAVTVSSPVSAARPASSAAEDISRQAQLLQELSRKVINMGELRRLASQGIPDGAGIRATVWKSVIL
ncbi:SH3 and multiple ankyrin repeat domains protein 1-like [Coffea eugenioides]|uniref:SH3 and multiple ankyrin repeat domains protein 1-like n=1 Tax=Coffea eugenioides TaxID=49369 RepID=UPI000F611A84|nr:SH3 and multiple ankyrin repeat domains protein 1-like [Coffea eugenioides]